MPAGNEGLFVGLISGTSRDGADAALVSFERGRPDLLHALCEPYPPAIRRDLDAMIAAGERPPPGRAGALDEQLGRFFARVANRLIGEAGIGKGDVRAIGSHGQTVWHQPGGDRPESLQLGSGSVIRRATGLATVTDFRRADLRAGGQGAPLAPLLHRVLFGCSAEDRAVLNVGGIANLTLLRQDGGVSGFDTGPGNCLMDAWVRLYRGLDYDPGGEWAAGGKVHAGLLRRMLADRYFGQPPPKSTGLEYFNPAWLHAKLEGIDADPQDVQCTLAELTAATVARSLDGGTPPARLLVCGGGAHNTHLLARLSARLPGREVASTARHGVNPDWVEAVLFAWLARERLAGRMQDTRPITGARAPVLLGKVYE